MIDGAQLRSFFLQPWMGQENYTTNEGPMRWRPSVVHAPNWRVLPTFLPLFTSFTLTGLFLQVRTGFKNQQNICNPPTCDAEEELINFPSRHGDACCWFQHLRISKPTSAETQGWGQSRLHESLSQKILIFHLSCS